MCIFFLDKNHKRRRLISMSIIFFAFVSHHFVTHSILNFDFNVIVFLFDKKSKIIKNQRKKKFMNEVCKKKNSYDRKDTYGYDLLLLVSSRL